jgi:hypothetical protein
MVAFIAQLGVDCHHPYELAQWWKSVLGYVDAPGPAGITTEPAAANSATIGPPASVMMPATASSGSTAYREAAPTFSALAST